MTYPCIHAVWARWAPPLERSKLATIAFSGSYMGTVVAMPVCAYLAEALGWESIFYVFGESTNFFKHQQLSLPFSGALGLIWFACWWTIVSDTPAEDPHISEEELKYITSTIGNLNNGQVKHPWKSIFKSPPVWACVSSHFCENWGFYTMLTQLPRFMKGTVQSC